MDIQALIRKKAREAGIDPTHALTMASIENIATKILLLRNDIIYKIKTINKIIKI